MTIGIEKNSYRKENFAYSRGKLLVKYGPKKSLRRRNARGCNKKFT